MLTNIFSFNYERNKWQAVLFFIVYLFLLLILANGINFLSDWGNLPSIFQQGFAFIDQAPSGLRIRERLYAMVLCSVLAFLVLRKRKISTSEIFLLLLANVFLSFFGTFILGLLIPSIFTTKPIKE